VILFKIISVKYVNYHPFVCRAQVNGKPANVNPNGTVFVHRVIVVGQVFHGSDLLLSGQVGEGARRGLFNLNLNAERGDIAQRVAGKGLGSCYASE